jgi:Zn-dependent protease with chaperone function
MTFALLGLAVVLVAFAAAVVPASLLTALLWPAVMRMAGQSSAAARARLLYALRALPVALGATAGVLAAAAWWRFEPRHTTEPLGVTLGAAAGVGLALVLLALRRGIRAFWAGRALARAWTSHGTRVQVPGIALPTYRIAHRWPVVCVVGALRPRLFVAEAVLDACTPEELASVAAHESGHVAARDNLKRLAARFLPDVLPCLAAGRALEKAWEGTSEAAADARAAAARPTGSLDLAAALLRVARLARGGTWVELPAPALLDGGSVAPRVERLLSNEPEAGGRGRLLAAWALVLALPAAILAVSRDPSVLSAVHRAAETLVQSR